jgi:hypothetical protein
MNQKQTIKFLLFGIPLFLGMLIFLYVRVYIREKKYRFRGVVQVVIYDDKGTPDVTVNGVKYKLSYNDWNFDHQIQKGDSLIKESNIMVIKLVKLNSGDVIFFK